MIALLCGTASAGSAPELAFARGDVLVAAGDEDGALAAFDEVVDRFPASPRAGEAAIRTLELLDRSSRFAELCARAGRLTRDRPLLVRHRAFARQVRRIFLSCVRRDEPPPPTDFEQEALERLAEFAAMPTAPFGDELLYDAGWQFYISDHRDEAARAWRVLIALYPRSPLARRARIGLPP
ncbi:MAG: tetratricopeptide repeat protein [Acidobacteriota bacterium]